MLAGCESRLLHLAGWLLLVAAVPAFAQVYLWPDEEGRTQLTKEPPKDWKPEPTVWCPYYAKARAYLCSRKIPFTDHDIEQSAEGLAQYRNHGGRGVPLIFVGQQRMNGFSEGRMAEMLAHAGY